MGNTTSAPQRAPQPALIAGSGIGGITYRTAADATLSESYASVEDFRLTSLTEDVQHDFATAAVELHLRIASRKFDAALGQRFPVPLARYSEAVVWAVCELAYAQLMRVRGVEPGSEAATRVEARRLEALAWVGDAVDRLITPDQRLPELHQTSAVTTTSAPRRGWWD